MIFEYMIHGDLAELLRRNDPVMRKNENDFKLQKVFQKFRYPYLNSKSKVCCQFKKKLWHNYFDPSSKKMRVGLKKIFSFKFYSRLVFLQKNIACLKLRFAFLWLNTIKHQLNLKNGVILSSYSVNKCK